MSRELRGAVVAGLFGLVLVAATVSPAAAGGSGSPGYSLTRATLNGGAESSSSASYVLTPTLGQELTIGTSASPRFVLQSGFWSTLGSGLVPVLLAVDTGSVPDAVDLSWSGNNAPYDMYQSVDCSAVFAGSTITTSANALDDVGTAPGGLSCFNVLATAPGPIVVP